jgi:hypothetical protein
MERWTPAYERIFEPDHELAGGPVCHRFAWLDICNMAQFQTGNRRVGMTVVPLERSEFLASLRFLAKRWSWSKDRVSRYLSYLEDDPVNKLKTVRATPYGTVYRVVSYETYANPAGEVCDRSATGARQERDTSATGARQITTSSTKEQKREGAKKRKSQLPDSWTPTDKHRDRAARVGIDLDREVEKFKLHAEENERKAIHWNSAFTRWLINAEEYATRNGNGRKQPKQESFPLPGTTARIRPR